MAGRLPKVSIDYAGWSVNLFDNEPKIDKLLDAQGWDGFGVYFFLCQRAYGSEGYFYRWCYDDCATTARKMGGGIGAGTVKETVDYCLQIGLFDKGLFDRWGVLTSRGIQKRYIEAIKKREVKEVVAEYWLLHENEECKGLLKLPLNSDLLKRNTDYSPGNANFQTGNSISGTQKKSKGKESKVEESKENIFSSELQSSPRSEAVYKLLMVNGNYHSVTREDVEKYKELYPAIDVDQEFRKMIGWLDANPKYRKTPRGINKFVNGWMCRAQDSARPVQGSQKQQPSPSCTDLAERLKKLNEKRNEC